MSDDACRADVWLWRARFFKTRSLAARFLDEGKVRLRVVSTDGKSALTTVEIGTKLSDRKGVSVPDSTITR